MASYTKVDIEEVKTIFIQYGITDIKQLDTIGHGISNTNYKITCHSGTKYVLKISNDKSHAEIMQEIRVLEYLHSSGYPYALIPIKTKNGDYIYQYGIHIGVLFPFVEGEVQQINNQTCLLVGQSLAKLHNIPLTKNHNVRSFTQVGYGIEQVSAYAQSSGCEVYFKEKYLQLQEHFIEGPKQTTIIHGDFYFDNLLIKNEKIKAVLDFEQSGYGPDLLDLGISISGSCLDKNQKISQDLVSHLITGYQQFRPLNQKQLDFIPHAIIMGLFSIALWRIKRFIQRNIDPLKRDSYKELLDRAYFYAQSKHQL